MTSVGSIETILAPRELGKLLHHALIDRALERNDQIGKIFHWLPAPAVELRLVTAAGTFDVDLGVAAGEPQRVPFLPLAAIAALPGAPGDDAGDVVDQPVRHLAELLDRPDAGLLIEFALRRRPGVFAGVDAALRHLPDMGLI